MKQLLSFCGLAHDSQSVLACYQAACTCELRSALISAVDRGRLDLNWAMHRLHTPMAGGLCFTIRSLRLAMIAV